MVGDYLADGKTVRTVPDVASPHGGKVTDSAQLAGRVVATETYDRAGGTVTAMSGSTYNGQKTSATHAQSAGAPQVFAWYTDSESTATTKAKLADGSWRTTTTVTTTEPANGNRVIKVDDKGDGTAAAPEICTTTGYAASDNPQLLTLVSQKTTFQGACSGAATSTSALSAGRTIYDGKPFGKAGALGEPTSSQALDHFDQSDNPVYVNLGSATFDAYGRSLSTATTDGSTCDAAGVQVSGPSVAPAVTKIAFTPTSGALRTQVRTTGPMGADWATTTTQDPARGSVPNSTDANARVTTSQYDALGRLTAVWTPDRPTKDLPSKKFTYSLRGTAGPSTVKTESLNGGASTYSANIDLYDGLGRPRQSQRTSDARPNGRLITDTVYDTHGWAIKVSAPYYEKSSFPGNSIFIPVADGRVPGQSWNTYDGNGRVVRSEFRSNGNPQWATTTAYPGADRTDVTPPGGATATSTVTDARGRTIARWQYRTPTATSNSADADITTYAYTPVSQTAGRTDSSGNTWNYTYDLRGRQVSTSDPDTGTAQTYYDVNSRIDHTTDAKGSTLAYTYDLLGRKTGTYNGSVAPANQLASWTYDTLVKGQPASSTRYVGGASGAAYTKAVTGYDTAYRPLGTSITIPSQEGALAGTYTTTNSYSSVLGALTKTNIPAAGGLPAESVTYANSNTGLLFSTASLGQTVVMQVDYDPLARPIRTIAGDYGTQVVSTQQYDWATGRVINSCIDRQVNTIAVDQTSYTYTPSGRITSVTNIQDASATDTQCFTYDHLSRLTGAWTDNPVNLGDPSRLRPEGVCGGFGTCSDDKGNVTTETFKLERDGSWTEAYWNQWSGTKDHPNYVGNHVFVMYHGGTVKDSVHELFDTLQVIPGLNAVGVAGSAVMDAYDGNYLSAAQNLSGLIPGGRLGKAGQLAGKAEKASNEAKKIEQEADAFSNIACDFTSLLPDAHSFLPGTRVLLADGTSQAIETLQAGDQVQATDPATGKTESKAVTRTIRTPDDEHFTDLTLQAADSTGAPAKTENLTSTQHHFFWDETTQRWTNASELRTGDELRTADGRPLTVLTVRNYDTIPRTAYDLTIAELHTYYVLAGTTPVLVHNCNDARFSVGSDGVAEDLSNPLPPRGGYVGVPKLDGGTLPVVGNKIWGNTDPERLIGTRSPEDLRALASKRDAEKLQDFYAGAANAGKGGAAGRGPPYGCLLPP
ncbi:polymorphic toxin-type HINT domain-containing protein [Kitasatospora sp. NPDC096077]|uniref:polymorphic toxin-type HINT domain-containing protein n=1 Tax=Kitasatospora sp. NPDC096077 TaxID=3155544 RepID=UPI0033291FEB